ncbi:SusC/RagA family TonB-linked outer membrane protein [Catalinimonas alkaloidigena]|uniref:SusC/RagA family TonB-linked outer membrane protein n=1 Tax=Catalinimonas alkaloidigena TaxID=1075417 RepID=UPI002406E232|nr:TonB-dependent receptor [Catalinimonas alkaloidigena]
MKAQELEVMGIVTDVTNNDPLPGVTVLVKDGAVGTITDSNGKYSILVSPTDHLIFSSVGFITQEIPVNNQTVIDIQLQEDIDQLQEVVVVGYGTKKKVNLTGAVSQIDSKALDDRPVANVTQALQGAVPNLNVSFGDGRPGSNATLNIRGTNSISGGSPLVVIDGVPGDLDMINPRDIESVSVLKDASSSAIYGARGAFGVILITTKSGKKGGIQVNYSNNFSWSTPTVSTDFLTDPYEAAKLWDDSYYRAYGRYYTGYTDQDYEEFLKRRNDPNLPQVVVQNRDGRDMYVHYGNTDWWHYFFRDVQPSVEHSLRMSGGSEKVKYMISGRYYQKKGMMRFNQDIYKGINFRAKIDAELSPWLQLSTNTRFNASSYTYPGREPNTNFLLTTVHALPSYVPVNPDGTALYRTNLNNFSIGDGIFAELLHGKSKGGNQNYDFINTVEANAKITDDLNIVGNYTFSLSPYSSFSRSTQAPWSIYPGEINYLGNDRLYEAMNLDQYHVANIYGNYSKTLGKHTVSAMAGYNQELKKFKVMYGSRNNLLSEELNELNLGTGEENINGTASEWALIGAFYRLGYDFAGKYLLEVNGRYDGTSRFPEDSRFGFFPSVSAGWRVSEESFFAPLNGLVSDMKLRASYGSLGNQQVSTYAYIPVMNSGTSSYIMDDSKTEYITAPNPISPSLTWETITSTNVGIDLGFFDNRLTGSFDWYNRNTKDMLTKGKTLPEVFGANEPQENAADLRTRGWEVAMDWRNHGTLAGKALSYNLGLVVSDNKTIITKFDNPTKLLNQYYVGQELGEIWGYNIEGYFASDQEAADHPIDQTLVNSRILRAPGEWGQLRAGDIKFRDLNGDGIISPGQNTLNDHGDLTLIGNTQARYAFGFRGGANWNGFDLSFFVQGIGKQNWYPGNNAGRFWGPYARPYYSFISEDFMDKVWSPENPNAYFPNLRGYIALTSGSSLSVNNDKYLQDLAYLRMKNLTLGYSLPSSLIEKIKLSKVRLYFSGENLFTLTKLETDLIDPEQAAASSHARVYPFGKTYSFGVDLSF